MKAKRVLPQSGGTWHLPPNYETEEWEIVLAELLQQFESITIDKVDSLVGWYPYTACYRIDCDGERAFATYWYFVAEEE